MLRTIHILKVYVFYEENYFNKEEIREILCLFPEICLELVTNLKKKKKI